VHNLLVQLPLQFRLVEQLRLQSSRFCRQTRPPYANLPPATVAEQQAGVVPVEATMKQQTVEQKKQVASGKWIVAEKGKVVGEVTDNVFKPNKDFVWTNETEMMTGLCKQTWGEELRR